MNNHIKLNRSLWVAVLYVVTAVSAFADSYYGTWTNSSSTSYVTVRVDDVYYSAYSDGRWRWATQTGSTTELSPGGSITYLTGDYGYYPVDGSGNYTTGGQMNYILSHYQNVVTVGSRPYVPPKSVVRTENNDTYSDSWNAATSSDSWGSTTSSDSWGSTTSSDSWGSTTSSDSWNSPTYSDSWGSYSYSAWSYNWSYGTWTPDPSGYWEDQSVPQSRTNTYTATRTYGRTGTRSYSQSGTRTYNQSGTRTYSRSGTRSYSQSGTRTYTQSGTRTYSQTGTRNWTRTQTTYWSDGTTSSSVTSTWSTPLSSTWTSPLSSSWTSPLSNSWTSPISDSWTSPLSSSWTSPISDSWTQAISDTGNVENDSGSQNESRTVPGLKPLNWTAYDRATGSVSWGGWSPDVATQPMGTSFTQTRTGTQPWQRGETNARGDSRNVVDYSKTVNDSQLATGTKPLTATVTVVVNGSGSVSGGGTYSIGATATLIPASGATSYFAGFSGDLIAGGATEANPSPTGSLVVNANKSVVATFNPKQPQTITLGNPGAMLMTNPPFSLSWANSSGLRPLFTVLSGPAVVDATGRVTLLGTIGTVIVRASHPGSVLYLAAAPVDVSFDVGAPPSSVILDAVGASTSVTGKISGQKASTPRMNTNPISESTRSRQIKDANKSGGNTGTGTGRQ